VIGFCSSGAANKIGSTFTDSSGNQVPITPDGLLLAGWLIPGGAANLVNGTGTVPAANYQDLIDRLQAGAIVDGMMRWGRARNASDFLRWTT
jgi:hypothetical protein